MVAGAGVRVWRCDRAKPQPEPASGPDRDPGRADRRRLRGRARAEAAARGSDVSTRRDRRAAPRSLCVARDLDGARRTEPQPSRLGRGGQRPRRRVLRARRRHHRAPTVGRPRAVRRARGREGHARRRRGRDRSDRAAARRCEGRSARRRVRRPDPGVRRAREVRQRRAPSHDSLRAMTSPVPDAVAAEARAFIAKLEAMLATQPSVHTLPAELVRTARRAGKGIFPPPVFLDDATWVLDGGAQRLEAPAHVAIGGESAGAHLAALVLLRLRERRGFFAANLVYGAFALGMTPSQRAWGERNLVLSRPIIEYFATCFLPGTTLEQRRAPDISPLYADLAGLSPALFTVGTLDPLLDDSLFMHARWQVAGNDSTLRVWPHAIHGFNGFDLELGRISDRDQFAFLSRYLPTCSHRPRSPSRAARGR